MRTNNRLLRNFEKAENVLITKQKSSTDMIEAIQERADEHQEYKEELPSPLNEQNDDEDSEYLFGEVELNPKPQKHKQKSKIHQHAQRKSQGYDIDDLPDVPIRRRTSHALSEMIQPLNKGAAKQNKRKYKKSDNQGNALLQQNKIAKIFQHICEPSGIITVNSLGHALQKYHIDFEVRDVIDMIKIYYELNELELDVQPDDQIIQDEKGELNMSVKLKQGQFKQLYKNIRKKK